MSAAVAVSAVIAVFIGGGYMGERFSTSSKDLDGRFGHWNLSTSMLQTPLDHGFGKGLGPLPGELFLRDSGQQVPGYLSDRQGRRGSLAIAGRSSAPDELRRYIPGIPAAGLSVPPGRSR